MFREYLCPSSGSTTVCIQQLVLTIFWGECLLSCLDCCNPTSTTDSDLKGIISTSCCIHTVYLLMVCLDTPETCRGWRSVLRISCASSWFFFSLSLVQELPKHVHTTTIESWTKNTTKVSCKPVNIPIPCHKNLDPPPPPLFQSFAWFSFFFLFLYIFLIFSFFL